MPTRPGVHPRADLARLDREEVSIVNCLARSFYITKVDIVEKGNAIYKYALARPCDDIKYVLSYDRELVVLFSQYNTFEVRSLDSFKQIEEAQPELRLERAVRFLFSRDEQISQKIERFLRAEPEFPAVCPFLYSDTRLFSTQENLAQSLRKLFYSRDLFNFHSPLKTEHFFFGRNDLIRSIVDRHISNESTGVFGLRRTGKTSLIHALGRVAKSAKQPFLHIDCQTTDVHLKRWFGLVEIIISQLCSTYSIRRPTEEVTPDNAAACLRKVLVELNKRHSAKVLIAFDEVENISPNTSPSHHWNKEIDSLLFWQTIRALCQDSAGILNVVIVGINPILIDSIKLCGFDNPLFKFMNVNYIKGFSHEQTHEMCLNLGGIMGLNFEMRSTGFLNEHFGGNPYLIRQACSQIHQSVAYVNRPLKITVGMVEDAAQQVESSASTYASGMLEVLKDFYPDEFELLCWLRAGKDSELQEYVKNNPLSIDHLSGYGIIEQDAGRFYFRVKIFSAAMKQYIDARSDLLSQDARREYVSKGRGRIEQLLRQALRGIALSKYGRADAKEKIVSMLTKSRQAHLANASLSDVLSVGSSKLYLSDFFGIIDSLQHDFENMTAKTVSELKMLISIINNTRYDAHSNSISEEAFIKFRQALDELAEALEFVG